MRLILKQILRCFFIVTISSTIVLSKHSEANNQLLINVPCPPITNNLVSASQVICVGSTPSQLSGTLPLGGGIPYSFLWQQSTDSINWSSASGINTGIDYLPAAQLTSVFFRRIVISGGGCTETDTSAPVKIKVDQLPTTAFAGQDQNVCDAIYKMTANNPSVGIGQWSLIFGNSLIINPNSDSTTVNLISNGANIFTWAVTNGVCPGSVDTVIINYYKPVTASNAGPDDSLCSSSILYSLAANSPSSGSGHWNILTAGTSIASSTNPQSPVINLVNGQNILEWEITSPVCPSSRDTVIITVFNPPSQANAGNNISVCGDSVVLSANIPLVGIGNWSIINGSGYITSQGSSVCTMDSLSQGINTFVWTISSGPCPVSSDTVFVNTYFPPSVSSAGPDQSICNNSTSIINANTPINGTGNWNVVVGAGTISFPLSDSTSVSGLSFGQNSFEWVISNGVCVASRDTISIINFIPPSAASAGNDQSICGDSTSLIANTPTTGIGLWSILSGTGIVSNSASPSVIINNISSGSLTLIWSVSSTGCPASTDTVLINSFSPVSTAFAGNNQNLCALNASTLNGNFPVSGTGTWYNVNNAAIIGTPNQPGTFVSSLTTGQNIFEWVISNGPCPVSRDTVVITIFQNPSNSNAGNDTTICGSSYILNATPLFSGSGMWSTLSGSGVFSPPNSNNAIVSSLALGTNTLLWMVTNGVCPPSYDTIVVTSLLAPTTSLAGPDTSICSNNITLNANFPAEGTGFWSVLSSSGIISQINNPGSFVSGLSPGQNSFIWNISNGICPDSKDTVFITTYSPVSVANVGMNISTSDNSVQIEAANLISGIGTWTILTGQGTISNPNSPATEVTGLQNGQNILIWTVSNGPCPSTSDTLIITVGGLLIPEVITPNGDGKNDYFEIFAFKNIGGIKLEVFNRWGNRVFYSENYQGNFEGKNNDGIELADDSYFYQIIIQNERTFKGYLLVKRK